MKRIFIVITVLAVTVTACSVGDVGDAGPVPQVSFSPVDESTTTTTTLANDTPTVPTTQPPVDNAPDDPVDQLFVEVFFVKGDGTASPAIRAVDMPDVASNAIRELIDGPTSADHDLDLWTSVPADTLLLGLTIEDGLATIDLSREFEVGGGTYNILSRLAQVVYTLTQFPTVDEVLFYLDGEPAEVFSGEGVVLEDPVGRDDYTTILPIDPGPDSTATEPWSQADLPDITQVSASQLSRVALVTEDDVLNVRQDPHAGAPLVGMLLPGVVVERTGLDDRTGSSVWVQVETPSGGFWVNERFLAAAVDGAEFETDVRISALLEEFADLIGSNGDLRQVVSQRGLYVSHHADPILFGYDQLGLILRDQTAYQWPSNAISPDDAEFDAIPARTFAEAVADSFLSAFDDPDVQSTVNQAIAGGNGRLAEFAIPFGLQSFNYIGIHDPGDNPDYDGLDWITWYVSIDYEDGQPVIVGLTLDQWAP